MQIMNDLSKQIVNRKDVSTTEEKIAELEANCKAMTAEIEKLKAELAKKNETVWMPEYHDSYMYINSQGDVANTHFLGDNTLDNLRIDFNNVYSFSNKTRKHLKWYSSNVLRVQNKLMQLHELLCLDYFPNWSNINENKYYIYYNHIKHNWGFTFCNTVSSNIVPFTQEAAEKACEILNREKFMMKG